MNKKWIRRFFTLAAALGLSSIAHRAQAQEIATVMGQPDLGTAFVQRILQDRVSYRLSQPVDIEFSTELYSILARRNVKSAVSIEVIAQGSTDMSTLQAGLNAAAARSPVVLNVLGGAENETLCQAMAQNNRAAYVWVAGSNAQLLDPTHEPSCSAPNILRVAPYNQISGQFLSSSNYGGSVRLAAPGFNVPVLGPQGRALRMSGGSVAAALAGAQLAVFARENPSLAGGDLITRFLAKKTRVESSFAPYVQDGRVLEDNGL